MSRGPGPPARRSSWPALIVVCGAGLAVLMTIGIFVPPFALVMLLGVGLFAGIAALHYLVWGRWLRNLSDREADERDRDA